MTRRVKLPSEVEVLEARLGLSSEGVPPSVVSLAKNLGLTNATFWRHFPSIAQETADARRTARHTNDLAKETKNGRRNTQDELVRLRDDNAQLRRQLGSAAAQIQLLALENRQLREQLEQALDVPTLRT